MECRYGKNESVTLKYNINLRLEFKKKKIPTSNKVISTKYKENNKNDINLGMNYQVFNHTFECYQYFMYNSFLFFKNGNLQSLELNYEHIVTV